MKLQWMVYLLPWIFVNTVLGQSVGMATTDEEVWKVRRYALLNHQDSIHTAINPWYSKDAVNSTLGLNMETLSQVDNYNVNQIISENAAYMDSAIIYNTHPNRIFFKNPSEFFGVHNKQLDLVIEPILNFYGSKSTLNTESRLFYNRRGIRIKGLLGKKIGFQTEVSDIQERGPIQFSQMTAKYNATLGAGYYLPFKTNTAPGGVDYLDSRATFNFTMLHKLLDFTGGIDKLKIGDGYRSLFLSDVGNSYLYGRLGINVWKIRYQSIATELIPFRSVSDQVLPRKYSVMNYLSLEVKKNLTFGLFEGVMMRRRNRIDIMYLVPLIFLRSVERSVGSGDNSVLGGDFSWDIKDRVKIYGQLLFDEFTLSKIKNDPTYWGNKYGYQIGAYYVNAFGAKNLDLRLEYNAVRPYTYSHYLSDTTDQQPVESYTHYNQPLAHPLGAGFKEWIGQLYYQPWRKWYVEGTTIFYRQGLDSAGKNFGYNPNLDYNTRVANTGITFLQGNVTHVLYMNLQISYAFMPNMYLDFNVTARRQTYKYNPTAYNDTYFSFGVRMNTFTRKYDY